MPFGHLTISLVEFVDGPTPGELGTYPQIPQVTAAMPGCRHRPLTFQETAELSFEVGTQLWKSTIPIGEYSPTLQATLMSVKPDAVIEVRGLHYQLIGGVEVFDDFAGPFKATIFSKKFIG